MSAVPATDVVPLWADKVAAPSTLATAANVRQPNMHPP
jgi:hypothetical protein